MKTKEKPLEKMFREYERRITRLKEIEAELNSLDIAGYEESAQALKAKLKKPVLLEEIEEDLRKLKLGLSEVSVLIDNGLFESERKGDGGQVGSRELIDFISKLTLIGEGGMGAVYLFINPRLKRKEAIKIMREDLQTEKRAVKSFLAEARIAGNLNHENIIKIYDVIEHPRLAIRMEFVDGKDLNALIDEENRLPWQRAARIAFHVCNALHYAHEKGFAHRDVKPKNILVRDDGVVKVVDFGISIAVANTTGYGSGRQAIHGYSPLYSSPEQRIGRLKDPKSPLWFKSDMYAFGATCYEMVAGSPPFPPGSDLTYNHLYVKPESPASQAKELPEPFEKLIMACLEKDPEARLGAHEALKILSSLFRSRPFWNERTIEAEGGEDWMVTRS